MARRTLQQFLPGRNALVIASLVFLFAATRVVNFLMLQSESAEFVANDVGYYGFHLHHMGTTGLDTMVEYPLPALWILQGLYLIGGGWETWGPWFAGSMLVLDASVAVSLYRRRNAAGALFWILFTAANGAIVWFRFDLIPAALVAWACLWLTTRPRVAGALVGLGAAIKLWPALLAFPLATPRPLPGTHAFRRLTGFLVLGVGLGIASLLAAGWTRSASPLAWQRDRGLQIESVPATPLMFLRTFTDNPNWPMQLSDHNAIELLPPTPQDPHIGAGVELMLSVSSVLTVASFVLTAILTMRLARAFRRDSTRFVEATILVVLALVLATLVANKTLSTQYVLWLGGPVGALLVVRRSAWLARPVKLLAAWLLVVAAMTQYTYPWGTYGIMAVPTGSGFETSVLILRNLLLVGLCVWVTTLAWRATAPGEPGATGGELPPPVPADRTATGAAQSGGV